MPSHPHAESRAPLRVTLALVSAACLGSPAPGTAQTAPAPALSTIMALSASRATSEPVVGTDGALYGAASVSSSTTGGLIYRVTPDGSDVKTLYQLALTDGYTPQGGLSLGADGLLYGTTRLGNVTDISSAGTVYRLAQDGSGFATLHRFASYTTTNVRADPINTDGAFPESQLVEGSDGYLYGVTRAGGANGSGTVFKVARDGSDFASLHPFAAITSAATASVVVNADGAYPVGALVEGADGYFYGVTGQGGANGNGTVYRLRFDGSGFQALHVFSTTTTDSATSLPVNADGAIPQSGLVDGGDGLFYGVTSVGGTLGHGTIYAISPDGSVFTTLHDFDGNNGSRPLGALLLGKDGKLYGTTAGGGTSTSGSPTTFGTLFSVARDGTGFARHYSFDGTQGANPVGRLVQLSDDVFVGVTTSAGQCSYGTLYRFSFAGDTVTGNTRCGRRRNNDGGGGGTAPVLLFLIGTMAALRRTRPA